LQTSFNCFGIINSYEKAKQEKDKLKSSPKIDHSNKINNEFAKKMMALMTVKAFLKKYGYYNQDNTDLWYSLDLETLFESYTLLRLNDNE
jgi:hypothetical protein